MSKKNDSGHSAFQTITYSKLEVQKKPAANLHQLYELKELHPRLTGPARGSHLKKKPPAQESFKSATYPLSVVTETAFSESGSRDALAAMKLAEQRSRQTEDEKNVILHEARERAAEIIAAAESEADRIKKEISLKARQEGLKAAAEETSKRLSHLDELLTRLAAIETMCRQQHEEAMVELALSCTRRLLNRELSLNDDVITDIVREVFDESSVQGNVTLLLNRDDLQMINTQRSQLLSEFPQISALKIEIGDSIERGGCILESTMGRIDASLRSKFEELQRLLNLKSTS
ncbi:MAG: hypothetical protein JXR80_02730 [Deltaproteobacteria bacterium]|nr:hypothetical protein [Deltaproteobacteria bacterium]